MEPTKEQSPEQPYLRIVPKELWDTVDLTLEVGLITLPVHSLILASQSKVLREAILNCPNTSASDSSNSQRRLPLVGDEVSTLKDALTYLYRRTFAVQPIKLCSVLEAVRVAQFAHKYHCDNLTCEADAHLSRAAAPPAFQLIHLLTPPKNPSAGANGGLVNLNSWDALHFLDMAQQFGLPRFSAHCEHWLINQPQLFETEQLRLGNLPPACLARLARGLAMKANPRPSPTASFNVNPFGISTSPFSTSAQFQGVASTSGNVTAATDQPASQPTLSTVLGWHGLT